MPIEYAHALYNAVHTSGKSADELVANLVATLAHNGKQKALPAILKEYTRCVERHAAYTPTLTVARESDVSRAQKELARYITEPAEISLDENIVGGWTYTSRDTHIDASYKKALLSLYHRIINR